MWLPENGQLAVNLPLTPSRPAACSTGSAHPRTLSPLNRLNYCARWRRDRDESLKDLTKGEVCDLAIKAGLTDATSYSTVSCSHLPRNRNPQRLFHCGCCYACLVRRSGLWHAFGADRTSCQHDPWQLPSGDPNAEDLLALLLWLSIPLNSRDLTSGLPLPAGISPADLMSVQHRARKELSVMMSNVLPEGGPYRSGWQPAP